MFFHKLGAQVQWLAAVLLVAPLVGCADAPRARGEFANVQLEISPLDLPGIADAVWDLKIENNRTPTPDLIWSARITSSRYGDGAGSASYVGPCDADPAMSSNTITVNIVGIYIAAVASGDTGDYGDPPPAGGEPFNDPGDLTRTFACVANEDVFVQFDVSLMRPANQGFFDIAVNFNQIYCAAKFDCCDNDRGADPAICEPNETMDLLFDATGARATSYVLGFACTAGTTAGVNTTLLLDDIMVSCDGSGDVAAGNYTLDVDPSLPAGNQGNTTVFFQWASYRGTEFVGTISKLYWNFAFGVGDRDLSGCVLHTEGTADDAADTADGVDFETLGGIGSNITYPLIVWDVPLDYGGACTEHPVNASALVNTTYTSTVHEEHTFSHGVAASGPLMPPAHGLNGASATAGDPAFWADGSYAESCQAYRHPADGHVYDPPIGDGIYRVDPNGGSVADAYEVYCDMSTDGGGWTRVVTEDFETGSTSGWSTTNTVTVCGSYGHLVGGFNVISGGSNSKTYAWSMVPHSNARLELDYIKIDSWDDSETGTVSFAGTQIWSQNFCICSQGCQNSGGLCGGSGICGGGWNEERKVHVSGTVAHTTNSATVYGSSNVNQSPDDESWGLDNIVIYVR